VSKVNCKCQVLDSKDLFFIIIFFLLLRNELVLSLVCVYFPALYDGCNVALFLVSSLNKIVTRIGKEGLQPILLPLFLSVCMYGFWVAIIMWMLINTSVSVW
jgi:hypothetical protein